MVNESLDDLLTYEEAAREIGVTLSAVKQTVNRGLLHPIKIPRERHKFLSREEVLRYRDGKQAYKAQKGASQSAATLPLYSSGTSHPNTELYHEILETLQMLILVEGIRTSYMASIRDALINLAEALYGASSGLTDLPPQRTYQTARQNAGMPLGANPQNSTSDQVPTLTRLLSEILSQRLTQASADEQAIQRLQELLVRYTQNKVPFSTSSAPAPATRQ
jgi:hypothetical protein